MSPEPENQHHQSRGPDTGTRISGERARQGHIVLRSRRRRITFLAGLVGLVLFAFIVFLIAGGR